MRYHGYSSRFGCSFAEDQSTLALALTTLGLPIWSGHLTQISISLHKFKGWVHGSSASFTHLEGDPGMTLGE
jgi:hypothetical protein